MGFLDFIKQPLTKISRTEKIKGIIRSTAELVLETGILVKAIRDNTEEIGGFKLEGTEVTELLLAEISIGEITLEETILNQVSSEEKSTLARLYFSEIVSLLLNKYKYFKSKKENEDYGMLFLERYVEYKESYALGEDWTSPISRKVSQRLSFKDPMFSKMLKMNFCRRRLAILGFINEASEKLNL